MFTMDQETYLTKLSHKRTELARDRTALAMIRTSLALILAGIGFIGFGDKAYWFFTTGGISISIGIFFLLATIFHFYRHTKELKGLMGDSL